jgi:hypothetical protein
MNQIGIKGKVVNLQTSIKRNDDGELEATFKFSSPDVCPMDLQRLFRAQRAGNLEFSILSQQLELFSGKESQATELPVN